MIDFVPRTCTEIGEDGQVKQNADKTERTCLSFEEFRNTDAYVLLGPPGAGKTTVFKQEADCSKACYVTLPGTSPRSPSISTRNGTTRRCLLTASTKNGRESPDGRTATGWNTQKGSNNWIAPGSGFPAVRPTGSVPMTESKLEDRIAQRTGYGPAPRSAHR